MSFLVRLSLICGITLMIHSIISAAQYRAEVEGDDRETIPSDILAEGAIAFVLACYGFISSTAKFEPILRKKIMSTKKFENYHYRTDFMIFNHRGKYKRIDDIDE
eukprot:NODE_11685_length_439_cov_15.664557_g11029_i0.p1 GENE.NODE_11685_length_439_cov_15.664557_g11029_i0~~NODE_11685_length_439_cov_15.664557_g11029_i0.p1  ORF type:complete len:123 (-),score=27.45 NODE_11685_length_439_cov_15.664557_g11029_i0:71-385(-)